MAVVVALIRGVNVGGNRKLPMDTLRAICGALGHEGTVTYIQSGNAVFRTKKRDLLNVAAELECAIHASLGFRPAVALRTREEMAEIVAANPFAGREGLDPARLLVTFLTRDPGEEARARVRGLDIAPEELHARGRELYTCYQNGPGHTKINTGAIDRAIGLPGTARNWNTVLKLAAMANQ